MTQLLEGLIILSHGSRAPGVPEALARLARAVEQRVGAPSRCAAMAFNQPDLRDAVGELVELGCRRVAVVPLFLSRGQHLREDIPRLITDVRAAYPDVEVVVSDHLGADPRIAELIASQAESVLGRAPWESPLISDPELIEECSLDLVEQAVGSLPVNGADREVIKRMVHASGDLGLASLVEMSPGAVEAGARALTAGADLIVDVRMVWAGVDRRRLAVLGGAVVCAIDDPGAHAIAGRIGKTRSAVAVRRALAARPRAVLAIGNAPTALWEACSMVREGTARPEAIIGVPVGFVGAREAKEQLARMDVPYITVRGTRGGSPIAAAAVNAVLRLCPSLAAEAAGSSVATAYVP